MKTATLRNVFFLCYVIVVLSSCSGNKFLNRKYTSGKFTEHKKSLKHNTNYADTTANFTSSTNHIALKNVPIILENYSGEKIINKKIKSIVKKDSVFITIKKGRNKIITIKNNLPNVTTVINGDKKIVKLPRVIDYAKIKKNKERKIRNFSTLALCFAIIPILGFAFSITAKNLVRNYKKEFSLENKEKYKNISNFALVLSIIPTLFGILIVLAILLVLFMLLFGGGTLVVIM